MKPFPALSILFLLASFHSFSQVTEHDAALSAKTELKKEECIVQPLSVLTGIDKNVRETTGKLQSKLDRFILTSLSKNYDSLQKKLTTTNQFILKLPAENGGEIELVMQKQQITAPGFFVATSDGRKRTDIAASNHFTGQFLNGKKSLSALSFNAGGITGFISDIEGNHVIEALPGNKGIHILYNDKNINQNPAFHCATDETLSSAVAHQKGEISLDNFTCKTVKIYVECTYEMYLAHNRNVNEVIDFVLSMFNASSALFKNDGINVQISELFIWTGQDNYSTTGSQVTLLNAFQSKLLRDYENGVRLNADVAHIITPIYLGGGAASGYGIIYNCGKANGIMRCAVSSNILPFSPLPSFSYSVYYFTHETGHMLGSQHTQSCTWPGGPIDNCAAPEGSCPPGPPPVNGGTIMSYCDLTPYGINFLNGFGPLPSAFIRNHIESVPCLSGCADTICATKVKNISTNITGSYFSIKWLNEAAKYRIGLKPNTSPQWQYFEVNNTDSFRFPKTACESYFDFSIAAFCMAQNKYGTAYIAGAGDTAAFHLTMLPFSPFLGLSSPYATTVCPGFFKTLTVTDYPGVIYQWYNDGVPQPQSDSSKINVSESGHYYAIVTTGGCVYHSDSVAVVKSKQNPRITANITGKKVAFGVASTCTVSRFWDFGDGQTAWGIPQTHIYAQKGLYRVTVYVKAADSSMEQVSKDILIADEFIDSLDNNSSYAQTRSVAFSAFACRNAAVFTPDSMALNVQSNPLTTGMLNYFPYAGNTFFETPKTGTLEFKLYPKRGIIKLRSDYSSVQNCDTGFVLNSSVNSFDGHYRFAFLFNKFGGIRISVDSVVFGNVNNGATGPLKINKWNHVGISYGLQGIKVWINGQLFASSPHVVDSTHASLLGNFVFGTTLGYLRDQPDYNSQLYFKSFEGAIDLVRFSLKENDFTFSASTAWQGNDTVTVQKQVCYGSSFLGYDKTGTYFRQAITAAGCDSVTRINLVVNEAISVRDSLIYVVGEGKGSIYISNITAAVLPLKYRWSNADTTRNLVNVSPGKYNLIITDALGCENQSTHTLYKLISARDWVTLFPNPVAKEGRLILRIGAVKAKKYNCVIYDVLGRKYFNRVLDISAGVSETIINQRLMGGSYIIYLNSGTEKHSIKFVVH